MKEFLPYGGFLVQAVLFAFFMGKLSSRVGTLEENRGNIKDSLKRIHERLDDMNCVKKQECNEQSHRFEARIESYQKTVCDILAELKKNQSEMAQVLARLEEKTRDK